MTVNSGLVIERTLIKDLSALPDGPVTVTGWVETVRDQKKVQFVVLRDETGALQLVRPRTAATVRNAIKVRQPAMSDVPAEIPGARNGGF